MKLRKKLKDKKLKLSIYGIILFILLIGFSLIFINTKFVLHDELNLILTPKQASIYMNNNQSTNVEFKIKNNNMNSCKTACNFELIRLSDNTLLDKQTRTMKHNEILNFNYTLSSPEYGEGQVMYNFIASCTNIDSLLCPTDSIERTKTSLLFLNYNLSIEDSENKNKLMESLFDEIKEMNYLMNELEKINNSITVLHNSEEKNNLIINFRELNSEVNNKYLILNKKINLWNENKYFLLNNYSVIDLQKNKITLEALSEETFKILTIEKENIILNNQIIDEFNNLIPAITFYQNNYVKKSKNNFDEINDELIAYKSDYNSLINKNNNFKIINLTLNSHVEKYEIITDDGLFFEGTNEFIITSITNKTNYLPKEFSCLSLSNSTNYLEGFSTSNDTYTYNFTSNFFNENKFIINETLINSELNNTLFKQKEFISNYCQHLIINNSLIENILKLNKSELLINDGNLTYDNLSLNSNSPLCCVNKNCDVCRTKKIVPIIFIHGHSFNDANTPEYSLNAFSKLQQELENYGYVNAGELDLLSDSGNDWGISNHPITVRASYYYITTIGGVELQSSERIENYALRLNELIDFVKLKADADQVDVITHSMGGLVFREYLTLFGSYEVRNKILINSPNHGVSKRVKKYCGVIGADKECEDLEEDSAFLTRLNSKSIPGLYNIYSVGCDMEGSDGDGIVTKESALLSGATNYQINGTCTDAFNTDLHTKVLDTELHPELLEIITQIIKTE